MKETMPLPADQKPSPWSKLLAVIGIKPKPAFKPYDRVIPHPWVKGETLTTHYDRPGVGTLVNPDSLWGEKSRAAYKEFMDKPAAPSL